MPCTADLERRDYLDFLPKRPQGTTKILGTSAFAGTKTPAALKFSSKGATTACVETPVNCPHCGQKRSGRASVPMPALYPAFFFVLEKTVKSAGNAVIPTFPMHWSHGLQGSLKRRYKHPSPTSINGYHTAKKLLSQSPAKRPTFAFADESGYTLAFANRIAHSGLHAETGAVSDGGAITTLGAFCAVRKPCVARCQNGVLCRFGILAGRCSRRTQKAFGTATRLCASLSRGVAAPLGCVIFFAFVEIGICTSGAHGFPRVRGMGGITTLGALCVLLKCRTAACQSGSFAVF